MFIQVLPKDDRTRFFAFIGPLPSLPDQQRLFRNAADAAKEGYFIGNVILQSDYIESICAFQAGEPGSRADCIEITLKPHIKWTPAYENGVKMRLEHDFGDKKIPLYKHPDSVPVPDDLVDQLNEFIAESDDPVFETIRNDGGIKAISWASLPEIQAHFEMSGNCAGSCVKGNVKPTQSSVKTAIWAKFPYISDFIFAEAAPVQP